MAGWILLIAGCAATCGAVFMLVRSGFATYRASPHETPGANQHSIRIRVLQTRLGSHEACAAECSCGWIGKKHSGTRTSAKAARRDGARHVDAHSHGRAR
jgi:hypothetical protein